MVNAFVLMAKVLIMKVIANNENFCSVCDDCYVIGEDGECECECEDDGYCSACEPLGCKSCATNDSSVCVECYSSFILKENLCMCSEGDLAPSMERECFECRIEGCLSCSVGNAFECVKCRTGLLLKDGFCECSTASHKINEDGSCEVEGCTSMQK